MWVRLRRAAIAANTTIIVSDRAGGGLVGDVALYLLSAGFAGATIGSTLASHRAWASIAVWGYAAGAALAMTQLALWARRPSAQLAPRPDSQSTQRPGALRTRRPSAGLAQHVGRAVTSAAGRASLAVAVWTATVVLPLLILAIQRAGGHDGRAQEEVRVIEDGGHRLLEAGTPYLSRSGISALPAADRLFGYLPYQPGMTVFGIPRALDPGGAWWSDARVWFALVTVGALAGALLALRRAAVAPAALVRGLQVATVLPICALTLATGGDDLPVLALCLLALALSATGRFGASGWAIGAAAALKLFAWPVAIVLGGYAATRGRSTLTRYAVGALGVPIVTLLPVAVINPGAVIENVVSFPTGRGLVTSPAQSPLPGYLIAHALPHGSAIALGLLAIAAGWIAVHLVRHPPATAAATSVISGIGLLAAMLLLPSTRFGYLLYPVAFLVWAPALHPPAQSTGRNAGPTRR